MARNLHDGEEGNDAEAERGGRGRFRGTDCGSSGNQLVDHRSRAYLPMMKREGAGGRFGEYLCGDCANLPYIDGR